MILGSRIRIDFQRIRPYDLFVVRIQHSSPTLWQKRGDQLKMLCGLFEPFIDAFACVQEWELNTQTQEHTVRLDFLHKIAMAPSTRYEGPAFFSKYKAATLGGHSYAVKKEIQRYHVVNQFLSDGEMYRLLAEYQFFASVPDDPILEAFKDLDDSARMQPRVEIEELTTESIPTAILSMEALETIQDLRHDQFLRRMEGNSYPLTHHF